jgi:hypothetical protein
MLRPEVSELVLIVETHCLESRDIVKTVKIREDGRPSGSIAGPRERRSNVLQLTTKQPP